MRTLWTRTAVAASCFALVAACAKKQDDTPPPAVAPQPTAAAYPGYPQQGYPQQGQPMPAQGAYPPPAATYGQYPQPAPGAQPMPPAAMPAQPGAAPAASGQMAVPGPVAFQCQNDVPCGTHHCNLQYGKCAFPCQSAADCISPNQCMMGLCVPQMPQAH